MLPIHPNWSSFFIRYAEEHKDANNNANAFLDLSSPTLSQVHAISNLTTSKVSVWLYMSQVSNSVKLCHSITDLGNDPFNPASIVVGLDGFKERASPLKFQNQSVINLSEARVPAAETLLGVTNINELRSAEVPAGAVEGAVPAERRNQGPRRSNRINNAQGEEAQIEETADHVAEANAAEENRNGEVQVTANTFSSFPFISLPPFLWETAINSSKKPEEMFTTLLSKVKEIERMPDYLCGFNTENLQNRCLRLFQFLWLVSQGNMPPLISEHPDEEEENIWIWCENCHTNSIKNDKDTNDFEVSSSSNQVSEVFKDAIDQLITSVAQNQNEGTGRKSKSFDKLHDSSKLMILNASASSPEMPGTLHEDCREFFSCSTRGDAKLLLMRTLSTKFGCNNVNISDGTIMSLFNGMFLSPSVEEPGNFTIFAFPRLTLTANGLSSSSGDKDALIMSLKELSGEKLSSSEIKQAVNQDFTMPNQADSQVDFTKYYFKNFTGACCVFFSPYSVLPQQLGVVIKDMEQNFLIYEAAQRQNPLFCTQLLSAIDVRVRSWLEDCMINVDRRSVNDDAVNFRGVLDSIKFKSFSMALPWSIKVKFDEIEAKKLGSNESSTNPPTQRNTNGKRPANTEKENERRLLKCADVNEEWLVDNEQWNKKFKNILPSDRPKLNGKEICCRWWVKGYCFSNCKHQDGHVSVASLSKQQKKEISNWRKNCLEKST